MNAMLNNGTNLYKLLKLNIHCSMIYKQIKYSNGFEKYFVSRFTFKVLHLLYTCFILNMKKPILLFAGILFISCSNEKKINDRHEVKQELQGPSYDTSFKSEIIYPHVLCRQDNNVSYALLLSANYDTASEFPVIFFADPHADGLLPVEKYRELANHFGYIFIGNNNSKNGKSLEENAAFMDVMMQDALKRFSINKNRIYASGFSGGSKVAGYAGKNNFLIKGVIACGAAIPLSLSLAAKQFIYIGIAGNEDFNYTQMKQQDLDLNKTVMPHQLLTFDGKHEWCPVEIMDEAITGIELDAMKKKIIPVKQKLVDDFILKSETMAASLDKAQKKYELAHHFRKMVNFLDGLTDVSTYKQKAEEIENSDVYKKEAKAKQETETKEEALKNQYVQLFAEKDEGWWKTEIQSINQRIKTGSNKEEVLIQKRILSYLSLAAFSYSNNALKQDNLDAAVHYLTLYKIIDPPNSEHSYMLAEVSAIKNEADKSVSYLKDAVKLGFNDVARLENDAYFNRVKNSPAFNEVLSELRTAAGK